MSRRKNKSRLTKKILKFFPFKDDGGRFIGYCDYSHHRGIVLVPRMCESRGCRHYHKFYLRGEEDAKR